MTYILVSTKNFPILFKTVIRKWSFGISNYGILTELVYAKLGLHGDTKIFCFVWNVLFLKLLIADHFMTFMTTQYVW